jgi:hypothetical protein
MDHASQDQVDKINKAFDDIDKSLDSQGIAKENPQPAKLDFNIKPKIKEKKIKQPVIEKPLQKIKSKIKSKLKKKPIEPEETGKATMRINFDLDKNIYKQLKLYSFNQEKSISKVMRKLINDCLKNESSM